MTSNDDATTADLPGVPVADAIEYLRAELETALLAGAGKRVKFEIPEISVTLTVVATRAADASGKVRWWVVEAGGGANWKREQTQTMALTLHPVQTDAQDVSTTLHVAAEDREVDDPGESG